MIAGIHLLKFYINKKKRGGDENITKISIEILRFNTVYSLSF